MEKHKPFNAMPLIDSNGVEKNDEGKRVVVNSIGGKSFEDTYPYSEDKWGQSVRNTNGVIVWGPCSLWFKAKAKKGKADKNGKIKLEDRKFVTEPYWGVLLDDYNLVISFCEKELTF